MKTASRYFTPIRAIALLLVGMVALIGWTHGIAAGALAFVGGSLVVHALKQNTALNPTFQPTHGMLFIWSGVSLAEIFIPEVYQDIQENNSIEGTAFVQSGVVVPSDFFASLAQNGVRKVEIPHWNDLDHTADPNLSDDTDTAATPKKVTKGSMDARNAFLNQGWGVADFAKEIGKSTPGNGDPMTRIKNRTGAYWQKQFQRRVLAIAKGVMNSNVANDSGDMVHDIAAESTGAQTADTKISGTAIIDAVATLGDQFGEITAIAMHSVPYFTLVKLDMIEFVKDSTGTIDIPTYLGKRVIVDDMMPSFAADTSGLKYVTILFGRDCFAFGPGSPPHPVELERDAKAGNGAGLETLWERKTWLIHPAGMDWLEADVAGESATLAELEDADNWERHGDLSRKNIRMAFLITNA
jgi:hypothetical protein